MKQFVPDQATYNWKNSIEMIKKRQNEGTLNDALRQKLCLKDKRNITQQLEKKCHLYCIRPPASCRENVVIDVNMIVNVNVMPV